MKILAFSDLHAHTHTGGRRLESGIHSRVQDCVDVLDEMETYSMNNGIQTVLFGGDLFHTPAGVHSDVINPVFDKIKEWGELGTRIFMIVGNHDQFDRKGTIHSLHVFDSLPAVEVIQYPEWVKIGRNLHLFAVPFIRGDDEFKEAVEHGIENKPAGRTIGLFHVGLNEGVVHGDFNLSSETSLKTLHPEEFDIILSGHYHLPQKVGKNFYYIGAPLAHNWGDADSTRGFLVLDTSKKMSIQRVETKSPKFVNLEQDQINEIPENSFVNIVGDFDEDEMARIREENPFSEISFGTRRVEEKEERVREIVNTTMTVDEVLKNYAEFAGEDESDYLVECLREFMSED